MFSNLKKILNTPIFLTKPSVPVSTLAAVLIAVFVLAGAVYAVKNVTLSPTGDIIINPSGNVGVGAAANPSYKLNVNGTVNATAIYQGGVPFVSGGDAVPANTIVAFYQETCPTGWTLADGEYLTPGDIPDLRGIFVRGAGTNDYGISGIRKADNNNYSATYDTYYTDMFQGHWHFLVDSSLDPIHPFARNGGSETASYFLNQGGSSTTTRLHGGPTESNSTNGTPRTGAETAPANFALTYCMKTTAEDEGSGSIFQEIEGTISPVDPTDKLSVSGTIYAEGYARATCPTGMIAVPPSPADGMDGFCVDKYEAKNVGNIATSQAALTPWVSITQYNARDACIRAGKHLITEQEWLAIAHNVEQVGWNWNGGVAGTNQMSDGHSDNIPPNTLAADVTGDPDDAPCVGTGQACDLTTWGTQRRTYKLSNGEYIWDFGGNVYEWVDQATFNHYPIPNNWSGWTACATTGDGYCGNTLTTNDQRYGENTVALRAFVRSGCFAYGSTYSGAFVIGFSMVPSATNTNTGFRCAK